MLYSPGYMIQRGIDNTSMTLRLEMHEFVHTVVVLNLRILPSYRPFLWSPRRRAQFVVLHREKEAIRSVCRMG